MESDGAGAPGSQDIRNIQVDNAIRAIQQKQPLPEIDFSIHRMEDGTEVNTMERVCKGMSDEMLCSETAKGTRLADTALLHRRPGPRHARAHR